MPISDGLFLDAAAWQDVQPPAVRSSRATRRPGYVLRRTGTPLARLSFKRLTNPVATRAVAKTPTGIPTSQCRQTHYRTQRRVRRPKSRGGAARRGARARGKGNREEPRRSGGREPRSRGRLDYMDISTTRWGAGALEKKPKGRGRSDVGYRWDADGLYLQLIYTVYRQLYMSSVSRPHASRRRRSRVWRGRA